MNSKTLLLSAAALGLSAAVFVPAVAARGEESKPLETVASVDLARYTGKWYEISRYPNRFQKDCAGDTTADYSLRQDGKITVVNSCRESNGKMKRTEGTAKIADKKSNAKLKVTFFWPFYGDYWIIDLGKQYEYAVVSEPKRKYLWILSRTPTLKPEDYDRIVNEVRRQGFDSSKLIRTAHSSGSATASE